MKRSDSSRDRLSAIAKVASRFELFKPASEVLTKVKAVPTCFPQLNLATKVGGWPIERVGLIHGPSAQGKTNLVLGLGKSFLERGHFFAFIDAEHSTPAEWINTVMGDCVNSDGFVAIHPDSYERARDAIKEVAEGIGDAKAKGILPPDTSGLIAIDSIRKLFPKRMIESLEKDAEKVGVDGLRGLAGAYKAALNSALMDELVPILYSTGTALVVVARERKKMNPAPFEKTYEVGGGESLLYESSIACRITREFVKESDVVVGERIQCRIYKSKVGHKEGKFSDSYFHVGPNGFDRARDVLEMAIATGVVEKKSGKHWVTQETGPLGAGEVFGMSEAEALKNMRETPAVNDAIEVLATAKFNPPEGDDVAA